MKTKHIHILVFLFSLASLIANCIAKMDKLIIIAWIIVCLMQFPFWQTYLFMTRQKYRNYIKRKIKSIFKKEKMETINGRKMTPLQARKQRIKATNEINIIYPYRTKRGTWVYDDEDLGVYSEAFVMGSSEVIDFLVGMDCNNFTAILSKNSIPEYTARLINIDENMKPEYGNMKGWYELEGTNMKHWLCGCVLDYFENYPDNIYVKIQK